MLQFDEVIMLSIHMYVLDSVSSQYQAEPFQMQTVFYHWQILLIFLGPYIFLCDDGTLGGSCVT